MVSEHVGPDGKVAVSYELSDHKIYRMAGEPLVRDAYRLMAVLPNGYTLVSFQYDEGYWVATVEGKKERHGTRVEAEPVLE